MRNYRVPAIDRPVAAGLLVSAALAQLLACAPSTTVSPAPTPAMTAAPASMPPATPAATKPCRNGERLDTGCECQDGACFDICCGPDADCAHPASPGGPSACMLRVP